ncbi:hypothetical protein ACTMQO_08825 [Escherichia coli]
MKESGCGAAPPSPTCLLLALPSDPDILIFQLAYFVLKQHSVVMLSFS